MGVIMILLLVAVIVGWILLSVFGARIDGDSAGAYWTALSLGTVFLALVLAGVVMYLILSVKAINLNRRQSNFIDAVTHELKSPIASLKLYLQTINRHQPGADELKKFHRYMIEDVERLDQLVNQVLDAARLEKRPLDDEIEQVDLTTLLREIAETICLRYHVPSTAIDLDTSPTILRAPRVDLDLIFRNLIDNAVKYAGDEPEVRIIVLRDRGQRVVVEITDNGRGIPHKLRRRVFGRFVRVGDELERVKPGTGLGLYIVRSVVRRLKGQVKVRDRDDGVGTVFAVTFPNSILVEENSTGLPDTPDAPGVATQGPAI